MRILLVVTIITLWFLQITHKDIKQNLSFPPKSDQTMYLAGGRMFTAEHKFFWRAPLYGAWMGAFYLIFDGDQRKVFIYEKLVITYMFALASGLLFSLIYDVSFGVVIGVWTLNCKYLICETNGSHIFAGLLFIISLIIASRCEPKKGMPWAIFTLVLSTQARSEMWFTVILAIIIMMVIIYFRQLTVRYSDFFKNCQILIAIIVSAITLLIFTKYAGPPEQGRFSEAFAMNYALNYIDRNPAGRSSIDDEDKEWMSIWVRAMPGISPSVESIDNDRTKIRPLAAVIKYPREIWAHVKYNIGISVEALPAIMFGFNNKRLGLLSIISLAILSMSRVYRNNINGNIFSLNSPKEILLISITLSVFSLVPVSYIFRVVARYYLPFLPAYFLILTSICLYTAKILLISFQSNRRA